MALVGSPQDSSSSGCSFGSSISGMDIVPSPGIDVLHIALDYTKATPLLPFRHCSIFSCSTISICRSTQAMARDWVGKCAATPSTSRTARPRLRGLPSIKYAIVAKNAQPSNNAALTSVRC